MSIDVPADRDTPRSIGAARRDVAPAAVREVLLIEDDEDDVLIVTDELAAWPDFRVRAVPSVSAALEALRVAGADCVLLDLGLPDAVGLDGLQRLLAYDSDLAVVVLTGDVDGRRGAAAVAAGAQDYLIKGRGDEDGLVRAIRYAIERRQSARLGREAAVARAHEAENTRLQRGLLPAPILRGDDVTVTTAYQPGRSRQLLGGDFYDVVETPDGVLHALIGDVCGHGPDEAALGVRLRIAWRTLVLSGAPPAAMFTTLDRLLEYEREDDCIFATAAQVSVTADRRQACFRIAGHPPPVLIAAGDALPLETETGPALGFGRSVAWPETPVALPPDWNLLLYTDGLFEGRSGDGRLGEDGLTALLRAFARRRAGVTEAFLTEVLGEVTRRNGAALADD
ncbi:MAG: response regulator receiver modulated serine phosphatase, partial [Solirubrobacterales bacterium]|nr:response regulator receiver modulated serine phosphatase [Solirubrobacterales bacterium]